MILQYASTTFCCLQFKDYAIIRLENILVWRAITSHPDALIKNTHKKQGGKTKLMTLLTLKTKEAFIKDYAAYNNGLT